MNTNITFRHLFFVFISSSFMMCARDVQETVLRAHKLYEQGNVEQALNLYNSIEKKGPATWYNMGNCHYSLKNYMDALVCWKKAERDASWSELPSIYHNIDETYKNLHVEHGGGFNASIKRIIQRVLALFSLYGWQLLFLLVWVILLFFAARLARNRKFGILSVLSVLVLLFGTCLYKKYDLTFMRSGIIMEKNLTVYAGPGDDFHELGTLAKATEISICDEHNDWIKIRDQKLVGWVPLKKVEIV